MAIYIDDLGDANLPVELNNPVDGESLVWSQEKGAYINAPAGVGTEAVQDIVADMVEVDPAGSQLSLRLVSNYDDASGKLTFNVVTDGGVPGSGSSQLTIKENGASRGTATALDFVGSSVSIANGTATITGLLDSVGIKNAGVNVGNARSFNFEGFGSIGVVDGVVTVTSPSASGSYTLPVASGSTLGGIKLGTGLSIDGNGVVSVVGGGSGGTGADPLTLTDVGNYLIANG